MIIVDVEQGTDAWHQARLGIPTASKFEKIISPTGKQSIQWEAYAHEILAEEIVGRNIEGYRSADMEEGQRREDESVNYYELKKEIDTTKVGFITNDAKTIGCSPDRLVGKDGLLEMKNPKHGTQVDYLLLETNVAKSYWPQLQGELYVSERHWVDIMSYFPGMPEVVVRVERDEPYIRLMDEMLAEFNAKLAKKRSRLIELGHLKVKS